MMIPPWIVNPDISQVNQIVFPKIFYMLQSIRPHLASVQLPADICEYVLSFHPQPVRLFANSSGASSPPVVKSKMDAPIQKRKLPLE
jgi:hypothetical protein